MIHEFVVAGEPLELAVLQRRLADCWPKTVAANVERLVEQRVLVRIGRSPTIALSPQLPRAVGDLVITIGTFLARADRRFAARRIISGVRPVGFRRAPDGAPRLFGTDARLRNFMALAVHGPMLLRELRRITGASHMKLESDEIAQFGRGNVVRHWSTAAGPAVMLDCDHPVYAPLFELLLRLERSYPLTGVTPRSPAPERPPRSVWRGDRLALFGGPLQTTILMSLGVHGWTFEALCVALAGGYDRVVVKKAMHRLEDDGIVFGDRPRSPGFNARVVGITNTFSAAAELGALVSACVDVWPQISVDVRRAFEGLRPRSKAHLTRRGLWPYPQNEGQTS